MATLAPITLLWLSLAATPTNVPELGFAMEPVDGGVRVTSVVPGGPADGKLRVGMVLDSCFPAFFDPEAGGPPDDRLRLEVPEPNQSYLLHVATGMPPFVQLSRPPLAPEEEFPVPLTEKEVARLSLAARDRYAKYRRSMGAEVYRKEGGAFTPIQLTLTGPVAAIFEKKGSRELVGLRGGGASEATLGTDVQVRVDCGGPPLEWVKINLATARKEITLQPSAGQAKASTFSAVRRLELWRMADAVAACETGHAHSVPVDVEAKCGAQTYTHRARHLPLEVRCDGDVDAITSLFARRETVVTPPSLREGRDGKATVCVRLQVLPPKPLKLTPVLLDEAGAVVKRFPVVQLVKEELPDEVEVELTLPTQQAGTLKVAFESESWQGEKTLNRPAMVVVEGKQ